MSESVTTPVSPLCGNGAWVRVGKQRNVVRPKLRRGRPAPANTSPRWQSSEGFAGSLVAAAGPVVKPDGGSGVEHAQAWLFGLVAIVALGWLAWVVSRFGGDEEEGARAVRDGKRRHAIASRMPRPDIGARHQRRKGPREFWSAGRGSPPNRRQAAAGARPLGPDDDDEFLRRLAEQLRRRREGR